MTREKLLALALESKSKNLILKFATGTGKSFIALSLFEASNQEECYILVDKNVNKVNWYNEIEKHGFDKNKFTIVNYKSIHKVPNDKFLILDEGGVVFGEITFKKFKKLRYTRCILLDATIKESQILKLGDSEVLSFSLKNAVENEILPKPLIKINFLTLDNTNSCYNYIIKNFKKDCEHEVINTTYKDYKKMLYKNKLKKLINISCTQKEYYLLINEELKFYSRMYFNTKSQFALIMQKNIGYKRKKILGEFKTEIVKQKIESLRNENKRFIVFSASISQAKEFSDIVVSHENKNNREIINDFNNKITNELFNIDIIVRAENLVDIDEGIIVQLSRGVDENKENLSKFSQQLGRVMRGKSPVINLYVFKNTVDEDFLKENMNEELLIYVEKN